MDKLLHRIRVFLVGPPKRKSQRLADTHPWLVAPAPLVERNWLLWLRITWCDYTNGARSHARERVYQYRQNTLGGN